MLFSSTPEVMKNENMFEDFVKELLQLINRKKHQPKSVKRSVK